MPYPQDFSGAVAVTLGIRTGPPSGGEKPRSQARETPVARDAESQGVGGDRRHG
jgi:hypothetical protein